MVSFSSAQGVIPSLLLNSPLNCPAAGMANVAIIAQHGNCSVTTKHGANKSNNSTRRHVDITGERREESQNRVDIREDNKATEHNKTHHDEGKCSCEMLRQPKSEQEEEESEKKEESSCTSTTETDPFYYYYSVYDESSQTSSNYCYFYDGATSVSTIVSLPKSDCQAQEPKKSITKKSHRCRLDELYEYGKERKRSELKRFQEKTNPQCSFSYLFRSKSNRRYTPNDRSFEGAIISIKDTFEEESINSPGNSSTKMSNRDVMLKQRREIARARAKMAKMTHQNQEKRYVPRLSTSRTRTRTRNYAASAVAIENENVRSNVRNKKVRGGAHSSVCRRSIQRGTPILDGSTTKLQRISQRIRPSTPLPRATLPRTLLIKGCKKRNE